MGAIVEEYLEWNTPVVGAYLFWRFAKAYATCSSKRANPPFPLFCIVAVLLQGRAYYEAIGKVKSLNEYAARLADTHKGDKLEHLHDRIVPMLPFTLRALDIAVARGLLKWNEDCFTLKPVMIRKFKPGTGNLSCSVRLLGDKAKMLGHWMSGMTPSEISFNLRIRF